MLISLFRLALLLGKTVSELNMSWREFQYWQAYLDIEPQDKGANERTAALLSQITNMSGRSLPVNKRVEPSDFLGKTETHPMTIDQQIEFMKSIGKSDGS